jgi:predicted amidohydrolase YtcJ
MFYILTHIILCVMECRPAECLSVRQAVDLYTVGGAYTARQEHQLGRLLPGFQADFVVLDKDVCTRLEDLLTAKVLQVWVAGLRRL